MNLKQAQVPKFFEITKIVKAGFKQGLPHARIKLNIVGKD
jgi:hypothetical protein